MRYTNLYNVYAFSIVHTIVSLLLHQRFYALHLILLHYYLHLELVELD